MTLGIIGRSLDDILQGLRPNLVKDEGTCLLDGVAPTVVADERGKVLVATLPDPSDCLVCRGRCHTFGVDVEGYTFCSPCPGERTRHLVRCFNNARIPARYLHATIETLDGSRARAVEGFGHPGKGWWFFGETRSGKTHMMCVLLRYLTLERGIAARFCAIADLLLQIRATYHQLQHHDDTEAAIMQELGWMPVLVLDDVGQFHGRADFEVRVLSNLIEHRANRSGLTTCVTSNVAPSELLRAGEWGMGWSMKRVVGRLSEMVAKPKRWTEVWER